MRKGKGRQRYTEDRRNPVILNFRLTKDTKNPNRDADKESCNDRRSKTATQTLTSSWSEYELGC
jgi:hypothetical protein